MKNNDSEMGVRGQHASKQATPTAPTPTYTEAHKTNMPLHNGGLGA